MESSSLPPLRQTENLPPIHKDGKGVVKWFITIAALVLLATGALFGAYGVYRHQLTPVSNQDEQRYVTIETGMSSADVARALYEEDIIRSPLAFRAYARLNNQSHLMQAGFYSLSPSQSVSEIITTITEGEVADMVIHIPSGSQLDEVRSILVDAGYNSDSVDEALEAEYESAALRDKPPFADLEGYLFPDTYHIAPDADIREVTEMILANTERHLEDTIVQGWEDQGLDIHEGLTLASIVQKEAPLEDMSSIAGVFINRLDQDMKLDSDATVNYIFGTNKLQSSSSDISVSHPYNTYQNTGLPPGPINSPEFRAIEATSNPAEHDWMFFLSKPSGETVFSRTFDEHLANQRRYLD